MLVLGGVTFNSSHVMTRDHHLRARDTGSMGYDSRETVKQLYVISTLLGVSSNICILKVFFVDI